MEVLKSIDLSILNPLRKNTSIRKILRRWFLEQARAAL